MNGTGTDQTCGSDLACGAGERSASPVPVTIHPGIHLLQGLRCGERTLQDARTYNVTGEGVDGGQGWALLIVHGPPEARVLTSLQVDSAWKMQGWNPPRWCEDLPLPQGEVNERLAVHRMLTDMNLKLHWI